MKDDPDMIRSILLPCQSLSRYEQGTINPEKILHIAAPQLRQGSLHWRPGLVSDAIISTFRRLRALDLHDLGIKDSDSAYKKSGGLNELENLNNLRGGLPIKNLTPGKDAKAAVLGAKQDLQFLSLDWDIDQSENHNTSDHESQLEDLEPHLDLKELTLHGYGGWKLSSWLNPQRNLVKLTLQKCSRCEYLPALDQFPSLKVLVLHEMRNLEYVNSEENPACEPFFSELQLEELPRLKGWWRGGAFSYDDDDFPSFPRLSKLSIQDCPELRFMPLFPTLKDELVLDTTSWVLFQETMKRRRGALPLMNLSLVNIKDFNKGEVVKFYTRDALRVLKLDFIPELEELLKDQSTGLSPQH
ncbi:hypothetical protein L484_012484 [Morus notabilis]|uniref:R13L1/DRL21-like LRR repeat region domain-containing protein n=1 Tax=Morus notabilis TaxID=981085 RepID=W9QMD4_9ROSA|nr:hypothetical protein L484_012484 [Morus notabilis]